MNNIFSPRRFGLYIKQYAGENWKKLLQMAASIFGMFILLTTIIPFLKGSYSYPSDIDKMWDFETTIFWCLLFVMAAATAASMFFNMDSKSKRISLLTLPASNLEKFLTVFLFSIIGFYIVFFAAVIVADYARVLTAPIYAVPGAEIAHMPMKYFFTFGNLDGGLQIPKHSVEQVAALQMVAFSSLIILQAFYALAASIWPKNAKIRGTLAGICIIIGMNLMFYISMKICFPYDHFMPKKPHFENLDFNTFITINYIVAIAITIGTYLLTYKRFKESESIERW